MPFEVRQMAWKILFTANHHVEKIAKDGALVLKRVQVPITKLQVPTSAECELRSADNRQTVLERNFLEGEANLRVCHESRQGFATFSENAFEKQ